jgi:hypothetical protein
VADRTLDPEAIAELAEWLHGFICKYLHVHLAVEAEISKAQLYDIAWRWKIDMNRISRSAKSGVRPAKHSAYLAFWIRKLKPISQAYFLRDIKSALAAKSSVDPTREIIDINERAAIRMAFSYLGGFGKAGKIVIHNASDDKFLALKYEDSKYRQSVESYLNKKLGINGMTVSEKLIDDMRYRSFGPHHLVHIFDQFVFGLRSEGLMFQ